MGTPDFAVPSLRALLDNGYQVVGVFCQPDRPKGRGHKLAACPVKETAVAAGIPVFQPERIKRAEGVEALKSLAPDLCVTAAFGQLLSQEILDVPKLGTINVHASLLPRHRGSAPINWCVMMGETVTGITTMYTDIGMDTGDMLLKAETPVGEEETSGQLFDRLKDLGAQLLLETLEKLEQGALTPIPQEEAQATHAPMLSKELSLVDWTKPAHQVHDLIRGLNPWPSAVSYLDGKKLKLHASRVREGSGQPGKAFVQEGALLVYCGQGALELTELQTENGKRMDGKSYLLGHPLEQDSHFGGPEDA